MTTTHPTPEPAAATADPATPDGQRPDRSPHDSVEASGGAAGSVAASQPALAPARAQATDAATHAFLNCYLRESDRWTTRVSLPDSSAQTGSEEVTIPLKRWSAVVSVRLAYRSPTLRHRFCLPATISVAGGPSRPLDLPTLACLLVDELAAVDPRGHGDPSVLLTRLLDSADAVAQHLELRATEIDRLWGPDALTFIESEQALLLGHQVHPTPKSRAEMSPADRRAYSPETAGAFALHWLAVDPALVHHDSALSVPAPELARRLLVRDPTVDQADLQHRLAGLGDRTLVPAHPWEATHLAAQADLVDLFDSGAVVDLGPLGAPVTATTSVRTVYRGDWPWQLKFSLHVRVTNSMRVTLPKELGRAVEAARLHQGEVGKRSRAVAPEFVMVHDPAFLAVRHHGRLVDGLSVLFRQNRWPSGVGDVTALTTLCQDHPNGGPSRLGRIVRRIAESDGRTPHDVGREWFARFCDVAVVSLVRLYGDVGLCFEAHQQNTLVEMEGGWPARCVYRDSQGYFHRELAHGDMCNVVPGLGEATESIFPEGLADERLVYYLFLNLTLGVVNALGVAGCADEEVLLADLRQVLESERLRGGRYPLTLVDRLLDDPTWPCKANLLTRIHDMDELVGDIATQSAYVTIPNPLTPSRGQ